jgi:hypothetical protein
MVAMSTLNVTAPIGPDLIRTLAAKYATAKATEAKGFQTHDLPMEALGHGEAKGIRETLAAILQVEPADVVEAFHAA